MSTTEKWKSSTKKGATGTEEDLCDSKSGEEEQTSGEHNKESSKRGGASEAASPSPEDLPKNLTQALAEKRTRRGPKEPTGYK